MACVSLGGHNIILDVVKLGERSLSDVMGLQVNVMLALVVCLHSLHPLVGRVVSEASGEHDVTVGLPCLLLILVDSIHSGLGHQDLPGLPLLSWERDSFAFGLQDCPKGEVNHILDAASKIVEEPHESMHLQVLFGFDQQLLHVFQGIRLVLAFVGLAFGGIFLEIKFQPKTVVEVVLDSHSAEMLP